MSLDPKIGIGLQLIQIVGLRQIVIREWDEKETLKNGVQVRDLNQG